MIVREALAYTKEKGIGPERFEFQMLYGIRRDLQREITAGGTGCGSTCLMGTPGIRILCGAWRNGPRTSCSSCAT